MNKMKPTVSRIQWTTTALNYFLDLQHDVDSLRISKNDIMATFTKETQKDEDSLTTVITSSVDVTPEQLNQNNLYDVIFWYLADAPANLPNDPPSTSLEQVFGQVHVWHKKHKKV